MNTRNSLEQTLTDRGDSYGDFSQVALLAQTLKNKLITVDMTAVQCEAMQLICTKLARISCGDPSHADSWRDIAGYAELVVKNLKGEQQVVRTMVFDPHTALKDRIAELEQKVYEQIEALIFARNALLDIYVPNSIDACSQKDAIAEINRVLLQ